MKKKGFSLPFAVFPRSSCCTGMRNGRSWTFTFWDEKTPTHQWISLNIMCTSNKPKSMNTKASWCLIHELHTDDCITASWLGKHVTRERLYIFRLVWIAIKDWGETNSNTLSYFSCHSLMSGRLLDSLDNVQITLNPDASTKQIRRSYITGEFEVKNKSWGTHYLKHWYICQYGEMSKIIPKTAKTF